MPKGIKQYTNLARRTGGAPTHPVKKETGKAKRTGGAPTHPKSLAALRKQAAAKKRSMCPPVSKMSKAQLISFLKK